MHSTRLFQLLLLLVAIVAVAHASWLDNGRINENAVARRQNNGGDDAGNDSPSPTDEDTTADPTADPEEDDPTPTDEETTDDPSSEVPSSTAPPAQESSSVQEEEQSTTEPPQQSTTQPPVSSSSSSEQQEEEATSSSEESAEETSSSAEEESESSSASQEEEQTSRSRVISTKVEVVTRTNEDGSKDTMTSTSRTTSTADPDLNGENGDDDGGMSDSTRNTIIGVVVGVGGAIVLGAIALVAWRIWGRRKRAEENDALMDYDHGRPYPSTGVEKSTEPPSTAGGSTAPSRSPFQQTLENYHQPTPVNASSNF